MSKEFKAGRYYIVDPGYVIAEQNWDEFLDNTDFDKGENQTYKQYPIFAHYTAQGDGLFQDKKGKIYSVDSGILGIMPIEAAEKPIPKTKVYGKLGHMVEFKQDFKVEYNDGVFIFGDIVIDTKIG